MSNCKQIKKTSSKVRERERGTHFLIRIVRARAQQLARPFDQLHNAANAFAWAL